MFRAIVALAVFGAMVVPGAPGAAEASGSSGDGERLLDSKGVPMFLTALNYEGPADRAWQMWENDRFDANLIDADFGRAAAAGAKAVRLFVQAPLARDIAGGNFAKLDTVVELSEKRNLQLIVSLYDYAERDVARVSETAQRIAERYRGRPGVLAYDLKNEPRFNDLALARYNSPAPLQTPQLVGAFGERVPRGELPALRATDEGRRDIPAALGDDEAWVYANNLLLYREMLAEASNWVRERGFRGTTLDYLDDAAGKKWAPLVSVLNGTLQAWLAPQVQAIRRGDPSRPITLHHVDAVMASLPANQQALDYHTLHRYPSTGAASVRATLGLVRSLQSRHAGKPFVLGEFGYATQNVDPERGALHEMAVFLGLLSQGSAGAAKWMLNDMPDGFNMRERTLGAFRLDGSAKPIVGAMAALRGYLAESGAARGDLQLQDDAEVGLRFSYRAADALLLGGKRVQAAGGSLDAAGVAQVFITWPRPGELRVWSSGAARVQLDVRQLLGRDAPNGLAVAPDAALTRTGNTVNLDLPKGGEYVLRLGGAPDRDADFEVPGGGGRFFTQTNGRNDSPSGFSVTNADGIPFWDAFQSMGGVAVLGYPVSRRFELDGFTVQAFQKAVLQFRPDQADGNQFWFLNTFDVLHDRGRDDWLEVYRQTPHPFDNGPDAGLAWDRVVARHLAFLDKVPPPLKERFLGNPRWLEHYGLPVATQEYANSVVVRAQRATFQYWKEAVPWAAKGTVTVANGGDLAKEAGLFPWLAVTPENAPR